MALEQHGTHVTIWSDLDRERLIGRTVRIEVGYGLEGELPDATADAIIRKVIVPRFRGGDMPGGIRAGVDAIIVALGGKVEGVSAPSEIT